MYVFTVRTQQFMIVSFYVLVLKFVFGVISLLGQAPFHSGLTFPPWRKTTSESLELLLWAGDGGATGGLAGHCGWAGDGGAPVSQRNTTSEPLELLLWTGDGGATGGLAGHCGWAGDGGAPGWLAGHCGWVGEYMKKKYPQCFS